MVEEQEGVQVIKTTSPDAPPEMNAGSFDHRLRGYHLRDRA
jgi:hypothetical protein